MILTITLNPAIDSRYNLKDFQIDKVTRCQDYAKTAGGKGLNVSRILQNLGTEVLATGFLGGKIGEYFLELLEKDKIDGDFVSIEGMTRTCLAILGENGSQTEILETGPTITSLENQKFLKHYQEQIKKVNVICASGSLPKGIDKDFYKILGQEAKKLDIPFILDTSGQAFKEGIKGQPFLIKPNKEELESYFGKELNNESEIVEIIKQLLSQGIKYVAVSLGKEGALLGSNEKILKGKPPVINALNPVGSGDSMIGGFAKAILENKTQEEILKLGIACGTANAMELATGRINPKNVKKIIKEISICEL